MYTDIIDMVTSYIWSKEGYEDIQITDLEFKGGDIIVNFNYSPFKRREGYEIHIMELLGFIWSWKQDKPT